MKEYGTYILPINTAHDDIEFDVDNSPELCYNISIEIEKSFRAIGPLFEESYGVPVNVPLEGEVKIGTTLYEKEMFKFKKDTFEKDWANYVRQAGSSTDK